MLTLNDGRNELWQWDTGRTLSVDADCSQVHFSNKVFGRSIDVDVSDGTAIIPDILLQTDKDLNVWAFVGTAENGYTKISKTFKVNRRNKPADYVFTPPEQITLSELVERLDAIEESQDQDAIKNVVKDYLKQNPVEVPVKSVNGKTGAVELKASDVGAISQEDLQNATNEALTQAKESGAFDGPPGDDYVLTDADRQEIAEIAAGLVDVPNVKPVAKTEDMTQPVGVDEEGRLWSAPTAGGSGGGFAEWELLEIATFTPTDRKIVIDLASYGKTEFFVVGETPKTANKSNFNIGVGDATMVASPYETSVYPLDVVAYINTVDGQISGFAGMVHGWGGTGNIMTLAPSPRNPDSKKLSFTFYPYVAGDELATIRIYGR